MTPEVLHQKIQAKKSFLCVGLDPDPEKMPPHLHRRPDSLFQFCKEIVEATADYALAYKLNTAFFEAQGPSGWESLRKTLEIIPEGIFTIADAKRGDIGNTSRLYAQAFFETLDFDAITVAPYMGEDSVGPFLEYPGKWVFLLALTSNPGAQDFQYRPGPDDRPLYQQVILRAQEWATSRPGELGFVVGATRADALAGLRKLAPDSFFLVPGVGAQGGDLETVCREGTNRLGGLLINSSRGIIYAGKDEQFGQAARKAASKLHLQMAGFLNA